MKEVFHFALCNTTALKRSCCSLALHVTHAGVNDQWLLRAKEEVATTYICNEREKNCLEEGKSVSRLNWNTDGVSESGDY